MRILCLRLEKREGGSCGSMRGKEGLDSAQSARDRRAPVAAPAILIPLASAFLYAVAALMLKRATERGIGPWRVSFVTNWVLAAMFAPLWLAGGAAFEPEHLMHAAICGVTFFVGQVFTFLALSRGDVSVATPVLGTKVIFVALFSVALTTEPLGPGMWAAALLTTIATALLGSGRRAGAGALPSLAYGFSAASAFALTDVLSQSWGPQWGFSRFAPAMFLTVALLSLTLVPFFHGTLRELPWRWLSPGAVLLSLQAAGVAYSIIIFQAATATNVLYNSRGVWSVLLVWSAGHWFSNTERDHGVRVMIRRLLASLLLLVAVVLVIRR